MKSLGCLAFVLAAVVAASGCTQQPFDAAAASKPATAGTSAPAAGPAVAQFTPPPEAAIPAGPLGDVIRQGRAIFTDTPEYAKAYVGNGLSCGNCHLDAGRLANSAPLWGAYGISAVPQEERSREHVRRTHAGLLSLQHERQGATAGQRRDGRSGNLRLVDGQARAGRRRAQGRGLSEAWLQAAATAGLCAR